MNFFRINIEPLFQKLMKLLLNQLGLTSKLCTFEGIPNYLVCFSGVAVIIHLCEATDKGAVTIILWVGGSGNRSSKKIGVDSTEH